MKDISYSIDIKYIYDKNNRIFPSKEISKYFFLNFYFFSSILHSNISSNLSITSIIYKGFGI